tara:strand:- start:7317 stop:7511 length:195 start_codon:yes stop_codon:yes gene_type:complete
MKGLIILIAIYISVRYLIPSILKLLFVDIFKTAKKNSNSNNTSKKNKGKTNEKYGEYIDYEDID